jgi:hypothetical protein
MSITFFLNRDSTKSSFDFIKIYKEEDSFRAIYKDSVTLQTYKAADSFAFEMADYHDVLDYLEDVMDLLDADMDVTPFYSIDLFVPGYPIVSLPFYNKDVLLSTVRTWAKRV